jgi:hypothetical protein
VLILNLPANASYILGHQVVDRGYDILVESYVAHSPNIGQVEPGIRKGLLCSWYSLVMFLMHRWMIDYAINDSVYTRVNKILGKYEIT